MAPLSLDTTCTSNAGSSCWEAMSQLFENENSIIGECRGAIVYDSQMNHANPWSKVANYFLQRISYCPKILPYTDMVR